MEYLSYIIDPLALNIAGGNAAGAVRHAVSSAVTAASVDTGNALIAAAAALAAGAVIFIYRNRRRG